MKRIYSELARPERGRRVEPILFSIVCISLVAASFAGADISDKNAQLIQAAYDGNLAVVQTLLDDGADVNAMDQKGDTPLHGAVWLQRGDVTRTLVFKGANVNAENNFGATPLYFASVRGDTATINLLLEKGAQLDIFAASALGDVELIKDFLTDEPSLVNATVPQLDFTPLYCAAAAGQTAAADLLIAEGAGLSAEAQSGVTPLLAAVRNNDTNVAAFLITKGADVNVNLENLNGLKSLHIASGWGFEAMVKLLIDEGGDVNAKDDSGSTALIMAAQAGQTEIVKLLLENGADVNAITTNDESALGEAQKNGYADIVQLLEDAGAKE